MMNGEIRTADILAGLGSANREILSTCLALFDDGKLIQRLKSQTGQIKKTIEEKYLNKDLSEIGQSVRSNKEKWAESDYPDNLLRLILWIRLREAFGLPPRLCISHRSAMQIADDIAAVIVHKMNNPGMIKRVKKYFSNEEVHDEALSLDFIVQSVINDLFKSAFSEKEALLGKDEQQHIINEVKHQFEQLGEDDRQSLLEKVGADKLNDQAVRQILLTSGTLTAFSSGVSMAGFSAYILAAKISAFIPLLSGPALVSIVAVMSNPITVIGLTGGIIYASTRSAENKINFQIGTTIVSLLALQGINSTRGDIDRCIDSFRLTENLGTVPELQEKTGAAYKKEWQLYSKIIGRQAPEPDVLVAELLEQPAESHPDGTERIKRLLFPGERETQNAAIIGILTLGDIAYSAASIDPAVLKAADFARTEEIGGMLSFADLSHRIHQMSPGSFAGAVSSLKGSVAELHVAEQLVASELTLAGHQVSFPSQSNEEGWDLLVDGQKFQVKCTESTSHLHRHFSEYDYPVIANSELAEIIERTSPEWANNVYFVEGFSNEMVSQVTESSLQAGADMFNPDVSLYAFGIAAYRNFQGVRKGELTSSEAAEQILLDGSTRVGLAVTGGYTGATLGLLIFGPAGALVFGAVLPVLAQSQANRVNMLVDKHLITKSYKEWKKRAEESLGELEMVIQSSIDQKTNILRKKYQELGNGQIAKYIKSRMVDDARHLRETEARVRQIIKKEMNPELKAREMLLILSKSTIHPVKYQDELKALNAVLELKPKVTDRIEEGCKVFASSIKMSLSKKGNN